MRSSQPQTRTRPSYLLYPSFLLLIHFLSSIFLVLFFFVLLVYISTFCFRAVSAYIRRAPGRKNFRSHLNSLSLSFIRAGNLSPAILIANMAVQQVRHFISFYSSILISSIFKQFWYVITKRIYYTSSDFIA